jgi:hypothetical protein
LLRPEKALVDQQDQSVHVTLTNTSAVEVVAYTVRTSPTGARTVHSYPPAIPGIAPGASYDERLPLGETSSGSAADLSRYAPLAVLFGDGTGRGDAQALQVLDEHRAGFADEMENLLPLLDGLRNSPDSNFGEAAAACVNREAALRTAVRQDSHSDSYKSGMSDALGRVVFDCTDADRSAKLSQVAQARSRLRSLVENGRNAVSAIRRGRLARIVK